MFTHTLDRILIVCTKSRHKLYKEERT